MIWILLRSVARLLLQILVAAWITLVRILAPVRLWRRLAPVAAYCFIGNHDAEEYTSPPNSTAKCNRRCRACKKTWWIDDSQHWDVF